jgi:hypothetical protein
VRSRCTENASPRNPRGSLKERIDLTLHPVIRVLRWRLATGEKAWQTSVAEALTSLLRLRTFASGDNAQPVQSRNLSGPRGIVSMPQSLDKKVGEWRNADSKAREVEKALANLPFFQGDGPPPADDLVAHAKLLRKLANEKLKAAIAAMKPTA